MHASWDQVPARCSGNEVSPGLSVLNSMWMEHSKAFASICEAQAGQGHTDCCKAYQEGLGRMQALSVALTGCNWKRVYLQEV